MTDPTRVAVDVQAEWFDGADEDEGVVSNWFVQEGAVLDDGELLCEIQVEKVSVDVHAPAAGRLVEIVVEEDAVFTPDGVLAWIEPR